MAINRPQGGSENKEVSSSSVRAQKALEKGKTATSGRIRNALLLAGGLGLFSGSTGTLAMLQGCSSESGNGQERLGQTSEALASGWNSPTVPSLGVNANIAYVERSGPNITLYIVESGDIKKIGSSDGGATWNSPTLTPVSGANSGFNEFDFKVCGGKAYVVSERDGLSSKLYEGTWSGGVVSGLAAVPGTLNDDGANVNNVACDSGGTNIYASSDISSSNKRIHTAVIGTWTWSELTSCSDLTKDTYGIFVDTNDFYVGSDRTGTLGSLDLMVYNGGWNGTNCSGGVTNLNAISGSATVNDANTQGTLFKDSSGDLWYGDNGTIKWATMKTGMPDGGTDSGTGGADGGIGGSDAGGQGGSDGGLGGSDAGGQGGMDGGLGGSDAGGQGGTDAGAGGSDAGMGGSDAGMGGTDAGAGGSDAGMGGSDAGMGGSDAGTGGMDAGKPVDCFAKATDHPENFQVDSCDAMTVTAHVSAPTTIAVGNKVFTVTEGSGTFGFAEPNLMQFSTGVAYQASEPPTEADKIISNEHGITLGFEGTKTTVTYPDTLNPDKASGNFAVVAYTTVEGSQRAYDNTCKPENNSVANCTPVDFTAQSSSEKGEIPAGTTMYRELATGKLADDPSKFNTLPPVQSNTDNGGGCSVSDHVGSTRNNLSFILLALGLASVMRRRKKD